MKVGVIGLGSMGKRRSRDLVALGHTVIGYDLRPERTAEARRLLGISITDTVESLLGHDPEAIMIATPPDQHVPYYEWCFAHRRSFFSETNILTPRPSWFRQREAVSGVRGWPSATWRFHPVLGILRQQLHAIGLDQVNTVHHHFGGYLPLWHPWERYTDFYAGRPETCAAREMVPFELEWLVWIFGPVRAVCAVHDRRGQWDTPMDDTYCLLLEFASGLRGTLLVELHQVAPFRLGRVACHGHAFTIDLAAHDLLAYTQATDSWRRIRPPGMCTLGSFDFEDIYRAETAAFLEALQGRAAFPKTWEEDRHLSDVLVAAEESWRQLAWVQVDQVHELYDGLSVDPAATEAR